jgi:ABC-type branched-subunit amino acid transport system ATPase component
MSEKIEEFATDGLPMFAGNKLSIRSTFGVTVLFGKNGSGKSSFMRKFFEANREEGVHYVSPERGGQLQYEPNIAQVEMDPQQRGRTRTSNNFNGSYRQESIARISTLLNYVGRHGAGELAVEEFWNTFDALVSDVLPTIDLVTTNSPPFYGLTRTDTNQEISSGQNVLSTGETEAVSVALDVAATAWVWRLNPERFQVIMIDEIDAHFHPDLQVRFARFIASISAEFDCQILLATHNPGMIASLSAYVEDLGIVFMSTTQDEISAKKVSRHNSNLMSLLGGHALAGPLLGAPILIVEGADDYDIWSQVARRSTAGLMVSVIPAGGSSEVKKLQKTLELIYGSFREVTTEPAAHALLDGDQGVSGLPQEHVKFVYPECMESENLYFTDEVLASFGTNWETARELIKTKAPDFGAKSGALVLATDLDRKSGDFKNVLRQIQQIIDPKNVPWTLRVAQTLGNSRPSGMVEEFLGSELVAALWETA